MKLGISPAPTARRVYCLVCNGLSLDLRENGLSSILWLLLSSNCLISDPRTNGVSYCKYSNRSEPEIDGT